MVLITCISSINTSIYLASRSLFSWAQAGYGPKVFTKVSDRGIPYVAIHFCHIFSFISLLSYKSGSSVTYGYIINIGGVIAFIVWVCISYTHLRFRNGWVRRGLALEGIPYLAPLFPWANYLAIGIGILLCLIQSWSCFKPFDYKSFIDGYIMLPLFFVVWYVYDKFYFKKMGLIDYEDMEFKSGMRPNLDDDEVIDVPGMDTILLEGVAVDTGVSSSVEANEKN